MMIDHRRRNAKFQTFWFICFFGLCNFKTNQAFLILANFKINQAFWNLANFKINQVFWNLIVVANFDCAYQWSKSQHHFIIRAHSGPYGFLVLWSWGGGGGCCCLVSNPSESSAVYTETEKKYDCLFALKTGSSILQLCWKTFVSNPSGEQNEWVFRLIKERSDARHSYPWGVNM